MDEVKKKVLLDVFASPWTLLPLAGGVSAWLVSWGMDGNAWLNLAGLAGVLGGIGAQASRLIFGLEKITADAHALIRERAQAEQESHLDELAEALRRDGDPRTEACLTELRRIHNDFRAAMSEEPMQVASHAILENLEKLFQASVKQLEYSLELANEARRTKGEPKAVLQQKRESVVADVVDAVRHVRAATDQFRTFQLAQSDDELSKLREELDASIRVARRAEERMAGWNEEALRNPSQSDPSEFES